MNAKLLMALLISLQPALSFAKDSEKKADLVITEKNRCQLLEEEFAAAPLGVVAGFLEVMRMESLRKSNKEDVILNMILNYPCKSTKKLKAEWDKGDRDDKQELREMVRMMVYTYDAKSKEDKEFIPKYHSKAPLAEQVAEFMDVINYAYGD